MCSCFISVWGLGSAVSFFKEENYLPLSLLVIWVFHREGNKPGVKWLPGSARGGGGGDWCLCFHWVWRGAGAQPASPLRFTGVGNIHGSHLQSCCPLLAPEILTLGFPYSASPPPLGYFRGVFPYSAACSTQAAPRSVCFTSGNFASHLFCSFFFLSLLR